MKQLTSERYASSQYGLVHRKQILSDGGNYAVIARRVQSGAYEELFPGVYRLKGAPESMRQRLLAAVFWARQPAVASHRSAAALLRLRGFRLDVVEITVPYQHHPRLDGKVVLHRSAYLTDGDVMVVDGIPTTRVARTLFDLGSLIPASRLQRVILDALCDELVTPPQLNAELDLAARGRPGSAAFRRAMSAVAVTDVGGESWLEDQAFDALVRAGFMSPQRQMDIYERGVFLGRVDLAYPHLPLVIEADGFEFHSTRLDFIRDRQRQNDLMIAGWPVLRFTSEDAKHPGHFLKCLSELGVPRT